MDEMHHKSQSDSTHLRGEPSMGGPHADHDRHAGHSVAMFRDKFWWTLSLTIPLVVWSADIQHWLGYTAPTFPGSKWIPADFRNYRLRLWGNRFSPRRTWRTSRPQAWHDDTHQLGDSRRLWGVAHRRIRPVRGGGLVGSRHADHYYASRPLAGNARHRAGARCTQRSCCPAARHGRACGRFGNPNCSHRATARRRSRAHSSRNARSG